MKPLDIRFAVGTLFTFFVAALGWAQSPAPCPMPENLQMVDGVYQIGSCGDLYKFAQLVNGGATDIDAKLTADICVNGCGEGESVLANVKEDGTLKDGVSFTQWTPIGAQKNAFAGTFDGTGHIISGLYFNDSNTDYVGLFGYIGSAAKVQNLGVVDSYINGRNYIGGVVGYSTGSIMNSYNMGSVSGDGNVGGLVGYNTGVVTNNFNTGLVSGAFSFTGGVVGKNMGSVSNVYSVGPVNAPNLPAGVMILGGRGIGGVIGLNDGGTVSNAYYNKEAVCTNCGSPIEGSIGKNSAEFADSTVAGYLRNWCEKEKGSETCKEGGLNGSVWGQDLTLENSLPDFSGEIRGTLHELTLHTFEGDTRDYPTKYVQEKGLELPTDLVREDYVFLGWFANAELTGSSVSVIPAGSTGAVEYWAEWGKKSTITLNLNGGNELASGEGVTFYGEGKNTALPTPKRNGYVFFGWYANAEFTGSSVSEIPESSTGAVEYWAEWGAVITLHFNGGDELASGEGVTFYVEGEGATLPTPTRNGYVFLGWFANAEFTGSSVSEIPESSTGAVEYWAEWGATISLHFNGGDELASGEGVTFYVEGEGATLPTPKRDGYVFLGWFANAEFTGSSVSEIPESSTGAVEYWAEWGKKSTITLNLNGGDELAPGEGVTFYGEGKNTALPMPSRDGYIFLGWSAKEKATSEADFVTAIAKGETGDKTFYAQWKKLNGDGCFEIASTIELYGFANFVNNASVGEICGVLAENIVVNTGVLNTDESLNTVGGDFKSWTPMNVKSGVQVMFNGAGHVIGGLYFNDYSGQGVGLFGEVQGTVSIDSLGIVDSYFKVKGAVDHYIGSVGGFVGNVLRGTLTITNSYNTGSVSGDSNVGGLVGYASIYDNGTLSITNSYNAGAVSGDSHVGGLVGYASIYDNGTLSITNSYNMGAVSGSYYVGGLVGEGSSKKMTITNSYNAGSVSGDSNVGGLVGRNSDPSNITNSFFLATGGDGDGYGGSKASLDNFHNGTVAFQLHNWCEKDGDVCKEGGLNGSVWGQDLNDANSLPDFSGSVGHKYGSIVFFYGEDDKIDSAHVDAASELAVDFPNNVVVSGPIKFKRTFAGGGYSTIMLPFTPNCSNNDCVEGVNFYAFSNYENATVGVSEVSPSALQANTPYLVQAAGAAEIVFKNGGTFNTTTGGASENGYKVVLDDGKGNANGWTIVGTYTYKQWLEGDAGLGKTYGFVGAGGNDASEVGKFKKAGAGAYIYPMRAYLEYVDNSVTPAPRSMDSARRFATPGMTSVAGTPGMTMELPEEISIVIASTETVDENRADSGTLKVIGTINTRTGEFKAATDRWFDLNGRYLGNKKPTQKGAYYNNGKKVVVK
ncbi:InlB B-repeat-containing protein [Fibrobacter sp.]|uniref:InlB B-repeat-containing protein n=1 Tax=Fibrobacter sp. TaxID=35828 RepID=UPI00388F9F00